MLDRRSRAILALLVVGALALNFPVLHAVEAWTRNGHGLALGAYVFLAWALIIALTAWLVERRPPS